MPEPRTLLQLAGARLSPATLDQATLLLIDCQNEYLHGPLALPGAAAALQQIDRACARARDRGCPIVHVRHLGQPGGPFDPQDPRGRIAEPLRVGEGESLVDKTLPNAFAGTDLADVLQASGRRELIVAGFMTHLCVSSTVRAALDHGYRCTVIAAATATRDLPGVDGGHIDAATVQAVSLAALADRFAIIAADVDAIGDSE